MNDDELTWAADAYNIFQELYKTVSQVQDPTMAPLVLSLNAMLQTASPRVQSAAIERIFEAVSALESDPELQKIAEQMGFTVQDVKKKMGLE